MMSLCKDSLTRLTFLMIMQIASASFPNFLPCDDYKNSTLVDCKKRNLTHIPSINSMFVSDLDLSENYLVLIANDSFLGVPNVQSLNLSWNCAPVNLRPDGELCSLMIAQNVFVELYDLSNLSLAANSLTSLPLFPASLQVLNLEMNNIVTLEYQNMSGIINLKEHYLGMNCYYRNPCNSSLALSRDLFKDAMSLEVLSLEYNNLTSIPLALPSTLVTLDFSENTIHEIRYLDFKNLTRLKELNLRWNCQRCDHAAMPCFACPNSSALQIHLDAFRDLKSLLDLNLRGNSLHNLNDCLFDPLISLTTLELSDNFLAFEIANGTFFSKLGKVTNLKLNYNFQKGIVFPRLTLSPAFAYMVSLENLYIDGYFFNYLDENGIEPLLNLTQLQGIFFRTNFIEQVNLNLFSKFPRLKFIDLSENILTLSKPCEKCLGNTEAMPHSYYQELTLPKYHNDRSDTASNTDTQEFRQLYFEYPSCTDYNRSLDLSFNNIAKIEPDIFKGMEDVECLNLSNNFINQRLNGSQFLDLQSLKLLDLANNRFDLYHNHTFSEIPNLEILYLNNNEFQFMIKGLCHRFEFLENLTSLTFLSLSYNSIGIRISNQLRSPSLKYLVFRFNRLDIMWASGQDTYLNIFTNLLRLEVLDISYNRLQTVPVKVIEKLPKSLQMLYITFNKITNFPWKNIGYLVNLSVLDLSNNLLRGLSKKPAPFGSNFTSLNLESNQITTLNMAFFSNANALKYLSLKNNRIKLIDENSLPGPLLQNLESLDVSGNPLSCTCDAYWFINYLKLTKVEVKHVSTGLVCNSPETLQGQCLFSIDPRSCQEIYGHQAFIYTASIIILFTLFHTLKNLYWWDIWYSTRILKAAVRKHYISIPDTVEGGYDAFIAFDTQQNAVSDWVYNELVLHLEEKGKTSFKLCLEERDWVAGKSRIENLCDAVYKSKKTIFILCAEGFNSGLLRHTFFMAQQRLLDEKLDMAILVLLDKGMKMSKYLLSRKRVCKKSILHWPKNPKAQPYFWHSLRVLLTEDSKHWYDSKLRKSIDR